MSTGIRQYFSPTTPFPSRKDTRIGALATHEASRSMQRVLQKQARHLPLPFLTLGTLLWTGQGNTLSIYCNGETPAMYINFDWKEEILR